MLAIEVHSLMSASSSKRNEICSPLKHLEMGISDCPKSRRLILTFRGTLGQSQADRHMVAAPAPLVTAPRNLKVDESVAGADSAVHGAITPTETTRQSTLEPLRLHCQSSLQHHLDEQSQRPTSIRP